MIEHCIATASTGYCPAALSALNMIASVPKNSAVATSFTSARVGMGLAIMLSSICVATTTGHPRVRHLSMICRCKMGTSSCISSTPRSPRATMMPSESSMISSSWSTADGFSILAMMATPSPTISRSSDMSLAFCTKLSATQSTPISMAAFTSTLSFGVMGEMGKITDGVFTPLRADSVPPTTTSHFTDCPSSLLHITCRRSFPSSRRSTSPGPSTWIISGCGRDTRVSSPGVSTSRSRMKLCPCARNTYSSSKCPMRSLGPCRSARIPMEWRYLASMRRMAATMARFSS
mmetsp:Transcript_9676/g.23967  ORF Transcript_9676/g.23967 Transcript_9676/m.23967 type:complete len:290 (+) Transcript_9676:861-1730(+)